MTQVQPARDNFFAARDLHDTSQYSYLTLLLASVIVLAAVSTANVDRRETTLLLFLALVALIAIVGWALMRSSVSYARVSVKPPMHWTVRVKLRLPSPKTYIWIACWMLSCDGYPN